MHDHGLPRHPREYEICKNNKDYNLNWPKPRKTSPWASFSVFPCSVVIFKASLSWNKYIKSNIKTFNPNKSSSSSWITMSLRISSWSLNIIRCRVVKGTFLHCGNALFAAPTAALNSSLVVKGTLETTSCVAYHAHK